MIGVSSLVDSHLLQVQSVNKESLFSIYFSAVERRSLAGELFLSCAQPVAEGYHLCG